MFYYNLKLFIEIQHRMLFLSVVLVCTSWASAEGLVFAFDPWLR